MGSNGLRWEHPATDLKTFAYLEEGGGKRGKNLFIASPFKILSYVLDTWCIVSSLIH